MRMISIIVPIGDLMVLKEIEDCEEDGWRIKMKEKE